MLILLLLGPLPGIASSFKTEPETTGFVSGDMIRIFALSWVICENTSQKKSQKMWSRRTMIRWIGECKGRAVLKVDEGAREADGMIPPCC